MRVVEAIGMTSEERSAWRERVRDAPTEVELVEITPDDEYGWVKLATHYSEQRFVDTMPGSFMDALFPEEFEGVDAIPRMRGEPYMPTAAKRITVRLVACTQRDTDRERSGLEASTARQSPPV